MESGLDELIEAIIDNNEEEFYYYLEVCFQNKELKKNSSTYYSNPLSTCISYDRNEFAKALLEKDTFLQKVADKYISEYIISEVFGEYTGTFSKKTILELVFSFGINISEDVVVSALETEREDVVRFLLQDVGYSSSKIKEIIRTNEIPISEEIESIINCFEDFPIKEPEL